jgi:superfamily I DNA/RNA helicase
MPEPDANVFVIGDANQAIYGFRGADVRFIENFRLDYPGAKVYNLKKSYRCSASILQASGSVIGENSFLEGMQEGVKIRIAENPTDKSEAEFIARTVEQMIGGVGFFSMDSNITTGHKELGIDSFSDFAVLCRTGKQMKVIEKAFEDHRIPYQKIGEELFFRLEPVKSVIGILKAVHNKGRSFFNLTDTGKKIGEIELELLRKEFVNKNTGEQTDIIVGKYFRKEREENPLTFSSLKELTSQIENVRRFLADIALGSPVDTWKSNAEAVSLMTLHASKGLEFKCVFIAGCEDGLIPYTLFEDKKSNIDEERRLLYVGMTRAKTHLFLTYAKKRFITGKMLNAGRSPFIDKIEKELTEQSKQHYQKKVKIDNGQLDLF